MAGQDDQGLHCKRGMMPRGRHLLDTTLTNPGTFNEENCLSKDLEKAIMAAANKEMIHKVRS